MMHLSIFAKISNIYIFIFDGFYWAALSIVELEKTNRKAQKNGDKELEEKDVNRKRVVEIKELK